MAQWLGVLKSSYPETKGDVIMANGEKILPMTAEERKAQQEEQARQCEEAAKKAKKNKKKQTEEPPFRTYPKMLLEVFDWQLNGRVGRYALFLDDEYLKMKFPEWQGVRKNFTIGY